MREIISYSYSRFVWNRPWKRMGIIYEKTSILIFGLFQLLVSICVVHIDFVINFVWEYWSMSEWIWDFLSFQIKSFMWDESWWAARVWGPNISFFKFLYMSLFECSSAKLPSDPNFLFSTVSKTHAILMGKHLSHFFQEFFEGDREIFYVKEVVMTKYWILCHVAMLW